MREALSSVTQLPRKTAVVPAAPGLGVPQGVGLSVLKPRPSWAHQRGSSPNLPWTLAMSEDIFGSHTKGPKGGQGCCSIPDGVQEAPTVERARPACQQC